MSKMTAVEKAAQKALPSVDAEEAAARVTSAITQAVNTITANLKHNAKDIQPSAEFAFARVIPMMLNHMGANGNETETITEEFRIAPAILGQILMVHLPDADRNMTVEDKQYWLAVAHHMGPDWIESFRRTAAWMAKAEQF